MGVDPSRVTRIFRELEPFIALGVLQCVHRSDKAVRSVDDCEPKYLHCNS